MYYKNVKREKKNGKWMYRKFVCNFTAYNEMVHGSCDTTWMSLLMIWLGIKNLLLSHVQCTVLIYLRFALKTLSKKGKVVMRLIRNKFMKTWMVSSRPSSHNWWLYSIIHQSPFRQSIYYMGFIQQITYNWKFLEGKSFNDRLDKVKTYTIFFVRVCVWHHFIIII